MKHCPKCGRSYSDETLNFCLEDGEWLTSAVSIPDGPVTAVLPEGSSSPGKTTLERETQIYTSGDFITNEVKKHKGRFAAIAVVLAMILAGFGYGIYKLLDRPSGPPNRSSTNISTQRLSGDGRTRAPVISPDGKFMVYAKLEGGQQSLWIKQIQTGSNVNIVKPGESDEFWGITFSPDGNFVYYNAGGRSSSDAPTIFRVPTLGGTPTRFLANSYHLQFAPDGKQISFKRADVVAGKESILIANANGTGERELTARSGKQFFSSAAAWSPDGQFIAVTAGDDSLAPAPSMVPLLISVADGSVKQLGEKTWEQLEDLAWHPTGDSLLMVASDNSFLPGQIWEMAYPTGEYRRLTNDVNGHYGISITQDGKAFVTGEIYARSSIWVSPDPKPENAKQIMPASGDTWGIAWTPDGRIVYSSDQTGDIEIWIMDADGGNARALTNDRSPKLVPTVSRDGRYIVYTSTPNGGELVRVDITGGNPLVLTKSTGADNANISPDSKWVIYSAFVDGRPKVLRVPIDGGDAQILTTGVNATEPRYSNDGTRFNCFLLDEKSLLWNKVAIYPAEGGEPIKTLNVPGVTNATRGAAWTPDDKNVVVIIAPGEKQNLWQVPVDGGSGKQITDFDVPGIARREYSPDGKRIAIVRAEGFGNAIMITDFR